MRLRGVIVVAARTLRSRAYLQALAHHGLEPERVVLFGKDDAGASASPFRLTSWKGVALPDLAEPLETTCGRAGWLVVTCIADNINSPELAEAIAEAAPELVIYSGYGGQLVDALLLSSGPRFLHVHSGWLPDYRGSTTLYYALLNGDPPAASALLLDPTIDTGPVVARRHYPPPPAGMDVDRLYDNAIRSDLLVRVLREYSGKGSFEKEAPQDVEQGAIYYVIHPVLKHLALLSLGRENTHDVA